MRMLSGRMHWLTVGLALLVSAQGFATKRLHGQSPNMGQAGQMPYGMPPGMQPPGMPGGVRPAGGMMSPDRPMSMVFEGPPPMEVAYASANSACDSGACDSSGGYSGGGYSGGCDACGGAACGGMGCGGSMFGGDDSGLLGRLDGAGCAACGGTACGGRGCGPLARLGAGGSGRGELRARLGGGCNNCGGAAVVPASPTAACSAGDCLVCSDLWLPTAKGAKARNAGSTFTPGPSDCRAPAISVDSSPTIETELTEPFRAPTNSAATAPAAQSYYVPTIWT